MKISLKTRPSQSTRVFVPPLFDTREFKSAKALAVAQTVITLAAIGLSWNTLPPRVPLWYSLPWGEGRLASPFFLLLFPAIAAGTYALNLTLAKRMSESHPIFARVLFLTSGFISLLSIITVIKIISLVA